MAIFQQFYIDRELDNGSHLEVEFGQWRTPATFDDPEEVELGDYRVTLDGTKLDNDNLLELEPIVMDMIYNDCPKEVYPDFPH